MRSLFGWRIPGGAYEQSGFGHVKQSAFSVEHQVPGSICAE